MGKGCETGICTGLEDCKTQWLNWTFLLPRLMIRINAIQFNASFKTKKMHIAHETAICHNPPIHSFMGDRKYLADPQQTIP